jgi:mono/diheme cytochrome c family protein
MKKLSHLGAWSVAVGIASLSVGGAFGLAGALDSTAAIGPTPPASAKPDTAQGRAFYINSCARCHGNDARGEGEDDDGPDLHDLSISNKRIETVIRKGIRGEMPSFEKKYTAAEIETIRTYLRSLH